MPYSFRYRAVTWAWSPDVSHIFTGLLTGIAFASRAGSAQLGIRLLGAAAKLNDDRGYVAGPRERELERPVVEPGRKGREFSILSPSG